MLIDFIPLKKGTRTDHNFLYQRMSDSVSISFTSNNNLSLRKRPNLTTPYNEEVTGGEDMYLCMKMLEAGSKYLIDKDIKLLHKSRPNLKEVSKQFYNYGKFGVEALSAYKLNRLEFFYNFNLNRDNYRVLIKVPSPIKGIIHFNYFSLHLILLISSLILLKPFLLIMSFLFLLIYYLRDIGIFFHHSFLQALKIFHQNYIVNISFLAGAIRNLITYKTLFIPPSLGKSKFQVPSKYLMFSKVKLDKVSKSLISQIYDREIVEGVEMEIAAKDILCLKYKNFNATVKQNNIFFNIPIIVDFYEYKNRVNL